MKKCPKCDTTKPKSEFYKNASRKDGLAAYCRQCNHRAGKEWHEKNPDYKKEWIKNNPDKVKEHAERDKLRRYGLTIDDYNDLLAQQNNRCAICQQENESGRALYVDHDHSCCKGRNSCGKCVRKLLCIKCNFGIGSFQDNPQLLRQAAEYIEKHSQDRRQ